MRNAIGLVYLDVETGLAGIEVYSEFKAMPALVRTGVTQDILVDAGNLNFDAMKELGEDFVKVVQGFDAATKPLEMATGEAL